MTTAGPWRVSGRQSIRGPQGEYIAKVNWHDGATNARLIAAAPSMLAALNQCLLALQEPTPLRRANAIDAATQALKETT